MATELKQEILRYSKLNGYPIDDFNRIECSCGAVDFHLYSDDEEGGAYLICPYCQLEHDVEKSRDYILEAERNICLCENEELQVAVARAYYPDSSDPSWIYLGGHCTKCGLSGVYVDWKQS